MSPISMREDRILPEGVSLEQMRELATRCRNCPLWKNATQTVFGEGPRKARTMIVGEQPGDREDREGRPFVGPAGKLLDRALEDAGIERRKVWVTNAVKHFKWIPKGKVRLHQKPSAGEIRACRPWLDGELRRLAPEVLIILGATAARALLGPRVRVTADRGIFPAPGLAPRVVVTVHPSSLLRSRDEASREEGYRAFVKDLALAAK
jgi:uracil-DNA glycosylase family protein